MSLADFCNVYDIISLPSTQRYKPIRVCIHTCIVLFVNIIDFVQNIYSNLLGVFCSEFTSQLEILPKQEVKLRRH